ncbi:MAG: PDZ domain-containing protein [Planctomycetaceae bacterium]|nr:PDZ domain-containing protein [Planctomycetaceae bacterium]MCP4464666.1 PDZ domain-containing protein [Planctomycetaceae bacterium]
MPAVCTVANKDVNRMFCDIKQARWCVVKCIFTVAMMLLIPLDLPAQELSEEMRSTFQEMLPQLDEDLQVKVRQAMQRNRDYLELTPDQFERFRDHPANPFEGWDGIDPTTINGLIRLRFETQPIRSRVPCEFERQSSELMRSAQGVVGRSNAGTVVVSDGKTQIALGTVVSPEGHVVTKLSELVDCPQLFCRCFDGRKWSAKLVAKNQANDIAILKIPEMQLPPVQFATEQPDVGGFIFSTNGEPLPMAFGVYSNPPRSLIGENQAFLGVKPVDDQAGVRIVEVTIGSSADVIGLKVGDVLLAVNGATLKNVQALVNEIRKNQPGDKILVDFSRDGVTGSATATLAGRNVGGPTADRFAQMKTFGAIQSDRRSEFPLVFQHDTPLVPEQCGGPVTDLNGKVVGINIARGGRVASYAIPANHVQQLVRELLRPSVASKDLD